LKDNHLPILLKGLLSKHTTAFNDTKKAPNNNNNKNDQLEILGAMSKGSIRFNSWAASLPEKRVQSLVAEQSSVAK
jgi:hypothetical protein